MTDSPSNSASNAQLNAQLNAQSNAQRFQQRRSLLRAVGSAATIGCLTAFPFPFSRSITTAYGQEPSVPTNKNLGSVKDRVTAAALERGWTFLARMQQADGSLAGQVGGNVAVVSLAGLAWIAGGSLPGRGPYGEAVARAVDYVAESVEPNGFISRPEAIRRGPMYGQGFATLFLAEVIGMSGRRDLDEKLRAAVSLILKAQNSEGGWRYTPEPLDADLSVTICQMMALRAARNAGVFVPAEAVKAAVDYMRRSQNTDGGFMYQLEGGESRYPLTAGAIVALQNAGRYTGEELDLAYQFLQRRTPEYLLPHNDSYFFYAHYYAVQAMWQLGGEAFFQYYKSIHKVLVDMQAQDGSWADLLGRHYGTAMACLVLSAPRSLLPIFQR